MSVQLETDSACHLKYQQCVYHITNIFFKMLRQTDKLLCGFPLLLVD